MEDEIARKLEKKHQSKARKKELETVLTSSIFKKVIIDSAAMQKLEAY